MPDKKPIRGIFYRDIDNDYVSHIIKEIWFDKVYESYFKERKGLTLVDIGANVGLFSLYASPHCDRIYSVEPSSEHFEVLTQMLAFNKLPCEVTALNCAISNQDGMAQLFHNQNTTMFSLKEAVNGLPDEVETVETMRLDTLVEAHEIGHIDVLKIDCEGSEVEILCGDGFEKIARRVDLIIGEYHTWAGVNPMQLKNALEDYGFTFTWLNKTEASIFVAERKK